MPQDDEPDPVTSSDKDSLPDWDQIVERYAERVARIALRILGSLHDAEDVSQEVFKEAMLLHRRGPVRSWTGLMVRLATLRSLDRRRTRKPQIEIEDSDAVSNAGPEDRLVASELANWLRREVDRLPDRQAAVFTLIHFEQFDRNEAAATLEISPETVSTTLSQARRRLSESFRVFQGDHS